MKAYRRLVGDRGGIKFRGKAMRFAGDGVCNTISTVTKDYLIVEIYENEKSNDTDRGLL